MTAPFLHQVALPFVQDTAPSLLLSILLGLLQGLTEFLPISSSGHLVLAQEVFRAPQAGIALEVVLHAGTLLAVLVRFREDLWRILTSSLRELRGGDRSEGQGLRELGLLCAATLPVVIVGLFARDFVETAFESPRVAASMLCVTGLVLLATRFVTVRRAFTLRTALAMGMMQVVSLLPGISRSGATIGGGMFAGVDSRAVVRFSFLMSVPAILGSLVLELPTVVRAWEGGRALFYAAGFLAAFLSGLLAIHFLLRIVARGKLYLFAPYCLAVGIVAWFLLA